jgi:hypothetical protein
MLLAFPASAGAFCSSSGAALYQDSTLAGTKSPSAMC